MKKIENIYIMTVFSAILSVGLAMTAFAARAPFTKTGYHISEWNTKADGTGTGFAPGSNAAVLFSSDTTLYVQWAPNNFVFRFHPGSGTGEMPDDIKTYDEEASLSEATYAKLGYHMTGWGLTEEADVVYLSDGADVKNYTAEKDKVTDLYAVWEANTYRFVFDPNGGSGEMPSQSFTYDEARKLTKNEFTKGGSSFAGWVLDPDAAEAVFTDEQEILNHTSEDELEIILYALWKSNPSHGGNEKLEEKKEEAEPEPASTAPKTPRNNNDPDDGRKIYPGVDQIYNTADDYYIADNGRKIYAGEDTIFDTADDFYLETSGRAIFAGDDCRFDSQDDCYLSSRGDLIRCGSDIQFGTADDYYIDAAGRRISSGSDLSFYTPDDHYQSSGRTIYCGLDTRFDSEDDYYLSNIGRIFAGKDCRFDSPDDYYVSELGHKIHCGKDVRFGSSDDYIIDDAGRQICCGNDLTFGSPDDYYEKNGYVIHVGEDGKAGSGDDFYETNGFTVYVGDDGNALTKDDYYLYGNFKVFSGKDGMFGTEDDYYKEKDMQVFAGEDGMFGTPDGYYIDGYGHTWSVGPDGIAGTFDDYVLNMENSFERFWTELWHKIIEILKAAEEWINESPEHRAYTVFGLVIAFTGIFFLLFVRRKAKDAEEEDKRRNR